MKLYKNISLRSKLLIPSLSLIIITVLSIVIISKTIFSTRIDKELARIAEEKVALFYHNIQQIGLRSAKVASFTATHPAVQSAYLGLLNDSLKFESASEILITNIQPMVQNSNLLYNQKLKLTFYVPPARVLLRTWSTERGDEMSYLKKSVLHVNENRQEITGIEMGKEGMEIRGLSPIFSMINKEYLGVIEISSPLHDAINTFRKNNEEYAIYVNLNEYRGVEKLLSLKIDSSAIIGTLMPIENSGTFPFNLHFSEQLDKFYNGSENIYTNIDNNKFFVFFKLLNFNDKSIGVGVYQLDITEYLKDLAKIQLINLLVAGLLMIFGIFLLTYLVSLIMRPVKEVTNSLDQLAKGNLYQELSIHTNDEISQIAQAFNGWMAHLQQLFNSLSEMVNDNFKAEVTPLSDEDILTFKLIELKNKLEKNKSEENKRYLQEIQTNWISNGLSKFNDLIRLNSSELQLLSDNVLRELVSYLGANQGGFFIYNDNYKEDIYLELISAYAYTKKRFIQKQIRLGEGLLGTCAIEKYTIYKTLIPDDYARIRSGLGEANPGFLLLVPIKLEDQLLAVFEIASFSAIETYQINFVEYLANSLASALSILKNNKLTQLLLEQSQKQAEELEKKEIEMREKFEILTNSEQNSVQKLGKISGFLDAIKESFYCIELNKDGLITDVNTKILDLMQYLKDEMVGEHITNFLVDKELINFKQNWMLMIKSGSSFDKEYQFKARNQKVWTHLIATPQKDSAGNISLINILFLNITPKKTETLNYEREIKTINDTLIKTEYRPDGTIIGDNSMFLKLMGYGKQEKGFTNIFDFVAIEKHESFKRMWSLILKGVPSEIDEKISTQYVAGKWVHSIYIPVSDTDGNIQKVIYIAIDITKYFVETKNEMSFDLSDNREE